MAQYSSRIDVSLKVLVFLFWSALFTISLLHLLRFDTVLDLSNIVIGYIAWGAIVSTIVLLGRKNLIKVGSIFLLFFWFGFYYGSYLEPPADPLDHLKNSYQRCSTSSANVGKLNRGFWQYGMNAAVLCPKKQEKALSPYLLRADVLHGMYLGIGAAILFLVALSAGFNDRFAIISIATSILFFGTNVFSYFRYYSFAPSYSSLCIYWLWIAVFFFRRGWRNLAFGILAAALVTPILMVNHLQEVVFVLFLTVLWLCLNIVEQLVCSSRKDDVVRSCSNANEKRLINKKTIFLLCVFFFVLLFILPQSAWFRAVLSPFFLHDYWLQNQDVVFRFQDFHISGKIWEYKYRIVGTLGIVGFLPLLLSPLFIKGYADLPITRNRIRILILGLIPFFIYCLPLLNYIWLSNCIRTPTHLRYYYRFCYAALAWLPITYVFMLMEHWILQRRFLNNISLISKKYSQLLFITFVFSSLLLLSFIRIFPLFGKLDFIILDGKPWWPEWSAMSEKLLVAEKGIVLTDPVTGMVVSGVFGRPTILDNKRMEGKVLLVEEMDKLCSATRPRSLSAPLYLLMNDLSQDWQKELSEILSKYAKTQKKNLEIRELLKEQSKALQCLVNLRGFSSSWVPYATGHWSPRLSNTKKFYRYHYTRIQDLEKEIQAYPPKNCIVLYKSNAVEK